MRRIAPWAIAPVAALALTACTNAGGETGTTEPANQTLSAALGSDGEFDTLDEVITNAGLEAVLEGVGPYTVIAPVNAAFSGGTEAVDFTQAEMRAQGAELVRAHLLPGAVTRDDLIAAIERGGEEGAAMRTMSDGLLTFTRDGEVIIVTAEDGATAHMTGDEFLASNGVIQPVDGLLVAAGETPAQ